MKIRAAILIFFYDAPYERLDEIGRAVMNLKDEDIFTMEIIPGDKPKKPIPFERRRSESKQPKSGDSKIELPVKQKA